MIFSCAVSIGGSLARADQAVAPAKFFLVVGVIAASAAGVMFIRLVMSTTAKRSRDALLTRDGIEGVLIAETDKSLSQGLRSAYRERWPHSVATLVDWRFLLAWNHIGVQFWAANGQPSGPIAELPWSEISLSVSRMRLERSTRIALDMQLGGTPIHVQMAVRHDRRGLPYYSIEEMQQLIAEFESAATTQRG